MKGFQLAILGDGGAMPPVREGGVRTVVLPAALAYGEKGDGCLYGLDSSCRIPPNSEVRAVSGQRLNPLPFEAFGAPGGGGVCGALDQALRRARRCFERGKASSYYPPAL